MDLDHVNPGIKITQVNSRKISLYVFNQISKQTVYFHFSYWGVGAYCQIVFHRIGIHAYDIIQGKVILHNCSILLISIRLSRKGGRSCQYKKEEKEKVFFHHISVISEVGYKITHIVNENQNTETVFINRY